MGIAAPVSLLGNVAAAFVYSFCHGLLRFVIGRMFSIDRARELRLFSKLNLY
jgi:hypothetical protein